MIKIAEQDIIFLSYDEPNAEENWADLKRKVPWAKRVHGVEGSDAAHKACADLSDTKHFITVDGDTIIDPKFMEVVLDLDELGVDDDYQFSWCGKIDVNGLMYGNGSLKMWTKEFVKNMQTHENTDGTDQTSIEFCYFDNYYQLNQNYSTSIISSWKNKAVKDMVINKRAAEAEEARRVRDKRADQDEIHRIQDQQRAEAVRAGPVLITPKPLTPHTSLSHTPTLALRQRSRRRRQLSSPRPSR